MVYKSYNSCSYIVYLKDRFIAIFGTKKELAKFFDVSVQRVHENLCKGYGFTLDHKRYKVRIVKSNGESK